jgi:PPOX class probable F420-dependent enzyme
MAALQTKINCARVDLEAARNFIRQNHRAVLANRRSDGGVQQTPVLVNVDGEGRAIISSRETAYKVKNLRRDPWAQVCVLNDGFFGEWIYAEGRAEVLSLPEAMDPLIDYYKRFPDDNPDWDDYRERMRRQQRVLIRITLERAGPDRQG